MKLLLILFLIGLTAGSGVLWLATMGHDLGTHIPCPFSLAGGSASCIGAASSISEHVSLFQRLISVPALIGLILFTALFFFVVRGSDGANNALSPGVKLPERTFLAYPISVLSFLHWISASQGARAPTL